MLLVKGQVLFSLRTSVFSFMTDVLGLGQVFLLEDKCFSLRTSVFSYRTSVFRGWDKFF